MSRNQNCINTCVVPNIILPCVHSYFMHLNSSVRNTSTVMLFGTADHLLVKHNMICATGMGATIRAGQDEGRSESNKIKCRFSGHCHK